MRLTYARALYLALLIACFVLSLRPTPEVEARLETGLSPLRVFAELAAPFEWVRANRVEAAVQHLAATAEKEQQLRRDLYADEWRFTLPSRDELAANRRFVRADVIGRDAKTRDRLEVRLESGDDSGIEVGMPVIAGDAFVGRVAELVHGRRGVAWIELITARGAFVGARVESSTTVTSSALVVGGVSGASASSAHAYLAVHHPENPERFDGRVVVDESWSIFERFARESRGFELGYLDRDPSGAAAVRPTLDYENGLFHVAVVCPSDVARAAEREHVDELDSGRWLRARVISSRDPSRAWDGIVIGAGSSDGLVAGSAVVFGTRLVGRIDAVSRWSSKVSLLASRGFALGAVATVSSDERPAALGEIRSLGSRDESGACRYAWTAPRELAGEAGATSDAIVFTGSGDRGVPRGLIVGRANLPAHGHETVEFGLSEFADGSELGEVWVYVVEDEGP